MSNLETAARAYCAAKEADRVLRLGMRPDDDCTNYEEPDFADGFMLLAEGSPTCRHTTDPDTPIDQVNLIGPDPLPREKWCPACQHNASIIDQSRKIRARFGGLASAMMAAYRREIR